jgi:hypothetical protein
MTEEDLNNREGFSMCDYMPGLDTQHLLWSATFSLSVLCPGGVWLISVGLVSRSWEAMEGLKGFGEEEALCRTLKGRSPLLGLLQRPLGHLGCVQGLVFMTTEASLSLLSIFSPYGNGV